MNSNSDLLNHLKELEFNLLLNETRNSPDKLDKLIADEFLEFGSSGIIWSKQSIINLLKESPPIKITASDFKLKRLADDVALLTYKSHRDKTNKYSEVDVLRSSIWKFFGDDWKIIFHQGTISKE